MKAETEKEERGKKKEIKKKIKRYCKEFLEKKKM